MRIGNFGQWEGDKPGGHHPPNCTCVQCNERRLQREAAEEEERRAKEYDRRVAQSRQRGRQQSPRGQQPPPRSLRVPPGAGQGRPRRRGLSLRLLLIPLTIVAGLAGVFLYVVFVGFPATQKGGEPPAVVAMAPTEEPTEEPNKGPVESTHTPRTLVPTPEPEPTVTPTSPTLAQPRSQPVPLHATEPGPTLVPPLEPHPSEVPPGATLPSPTRAATAPVPSTPSPSTTPAPVATQTLPPTVVPSPTPIPAPHLRHLTEKQYMLDLINQERERAGVPPVELGTNDAAQLHAESALEHCFTSHWGVDGLKPYMRYSLAGGYQSNGENGSGIGYCGRPSVGRRAIQDIDHRISEMMDGWMSSPGHRRNLLGRRHKKVNIGIAWDHYNVRGYQHFEGDYIEYNQLPSMESGTLALSGRSKNGALITQDSSSIGIYYDPPAQPLTLGQLSRTYCYTSGLPVAFVLEPLAEGWSYLSDETTTSVTPCLDPYKVSPEAAPPSRRNREREMIFLPREVTTPYVIASEWSVVGHRFSIVVDIGEVLDSHGPGIYTMILFGKISGTEEIISEYSIFYDIPAPSGYD